MKIICDFFGFRKEMDVPNSVVAYGSCDVPFQQRLPVVAFDMTFPDTPCSTTLIRFVWRGKTAKDTPVFELDNDEHNRILDAITHKPSVEDDVREASGDLLQEIRGLLDDEPEFLSVPTG